MKEEYNLAAATSQLLCKNNEEKNCGMYHSTSKATIWISSELFSKLKVAIVYLPDC